jgi:hypothetical protein
MTEIDSTKHITRKQRVVNDLRPIRPTTLAFVLWQKYVKLFVEEARRYPLFEVRFDSNSEPWETLSQAGVFAFGRT